MYRLKFNLKPDNESGSAEFFPINKNIGFKQFRNKTYANSAWKKQKLLSKYNLAPKVFSKVCKIYFSNIQMKSNWGYVTERAKIPDNKNLNKKLDDIQQLVENIYDKTKLKFWDCHYYNVGYVKRKNINKLVCIDTGNESFDNFCNAWGFDFPGPKCNTCGKLVNKCKCDY